MSTINIQSGDLRVGNLILFDGKLDKVTEIYGKGVTGENHARWDYDRLSPIVLTSIILEDCGFELTQDGISPYWKLVINSTEVISIENDWSFGLNASDETSRQGYASNPGLCKYLHQLQNLYHSLTGKEIEYKHLK